MDPVTLVTMSAIGAFFMLNRVVTAWQQKQRKGQGEPPASNHGTAEKRMGGGHPVRRDLQPGSEAHQLSPEHLRVNPPAPAPEPAAPGGPEPAQPETVAVVRDRLTGRFSKKRGPVDGGATRPTQPQAAAA